MYSCPGTNATTHMMLYCTVQYCTSLPLSNPMHVPSHVTCPSLRGAMGKRPGHEGGPIGRKNISVPASADRAVHARIIAKTVYFACRRAT